MGVQNLPKSTSGVTNTNLAVSVTTPRTNEHELNPVAYLSVCKFFISRTKKKKKKKKGERKMKSKAEVKIFVVFV